MTDAVLTINAGSSTIKAALFEADGGGTLSLVFRAVVDSVGKSPRLAVRDAAGDLRSERDLDDALDFDGLLREVVALAERHCGDDRLVAAGHRVVHGGPDHAGPERVTPDLLAVLDGLAPLAPLHEPHNVAPMRALARLRPDLPQVACFDTAFHRTMPAVAQRFGLPRDLEAAGVHRYGFHGLSYEYVAGRLSEIDPALARGRVIVAHLGSGASLCALQAGRSVDTTMGFTPLDGLVMATRCGSLDPGVVLYLQQERKMSPDAVADMLYRRSGMLGVSGGLSGDMRDLLASTDERAKEAVALFVYRVAREAGALAAALGGLDGLVFTAGIGENAPAVRAAVCERLAWLGVAIDPAANDANSGPIGQAGSRVSVRVVPTDEEAMIARHAWRIAAGRAAGA